MTYLTLIILIAAFAFGGCSSINSANIADASPTPLERMTMCHTDAKFDQCLPPNAREILENAEEFEVLHLDENTKSARIESFDAANATVSFNKIAQITDKEQRSKLVNALYDDIRADSGASACFGPRHTIRAKYQDTYALVIMCYECYNFRGVTYKERQGSGKIKTIC